MNLPLLSDAELANEFVSVIQAGAQPQQSRRQYFRLVDWQLDEISIEFRRRYYDRLRDLAGVSEGDVDAHGQVTGQLTVYDVL